MNCTEFIDRWSNCSYLKTARRQKNHLMNVLYWMQTCGRGRCGCEHNCSVHRCNAAKQFLLYVCILTHFPPSAIVMLILFRKNLRIKRLDIETSRHLIISFSCLFRYHMRTLLSNWKQFQLAEIWNSKNQCTDIVLSITKTCFSHAHLLILLSIALIIMISSNIFQCLDERLIKYLYCSFYIENLRNITQWAFAWVLKNVLWLYYVSHSLVQHQNEINWEQ